MCDRALNSFPPGSQRISSMFVNFGILKKKL